MKRVLSLIILLCIAAPAWHALAVKKQPLKVLYVGGSTDLSEVPDGQRDQLVKERSDAFKNLLEQYFTSVTAVMGNEYSADMSKGYDVTVLDGIPKAISERVYEKDAAGNLLKYAPAAYLPADYDCATVTIGKIGEAVGRSIGSKNDWYCLCLDAQAHHWVKDHPIFKGPFKVTMTVMECPTPEDAFHYEYFYDGPTPKTLPMWRVQTKGYITDPGFSVGMVSRPWGYTDSPDAEYISSGVCAKTLDAVAIGRHGNFLHWGFAASPLYMTDEAKTVFANAVAYIAKFKGTTLKARKFNDRIATRDYLKEIAYLVTKDYYNERTKDDRKWHAERVKGYKELLAKKEAGQELSKREQQELSYGDPGEFKPKSYDEFVQRYAKEFYPMFGTDEKAYAKYFKDNYDYFYSEGFYNIFLDEDVKAWGIPNNNHKLLDKAISCLENGTETDRANRILARYTMADFKTPAEWRKWYDTYKDKMYFTESGGWKFLIDGDASIPGNDYFEYQKRVNESTNASTGTETSDANPVVTSARIINPNTEKPLLEIKFKIHPGYHIYAFVADDDPYMVTEINLELPDGLKAGEWSITRPGQFGESGTTIHEEEATYTCPLEGHGKGDIKCKVSYQVCDTHICMPPASKELNLSI